MKRPSTIKSSLLLLAVSLIMAAACSLIITQSAFAAESIKYGWIALDANNKPVLQGSQYPVSNNVKPVKKISNGKVTKTVSDKSVVYLCNNKVGTAQALIVGKNVIGCKDAFITTFTIVKKSEISKANVDTIPAQRYTGKSIQPKVTVRYSNAVLKENVDYKLSYKNNISSGTATIIITGIGDYTGTKNKTFTISQPMYTVKFKANGGKGTMIDQNIVKNKSTALKKCTYTRPGYVFCGWNTKKNGKGKSYTDKKKVKNLAQINKTCILYAQWKYRGDIAAEAARKAAKEKKESTKVAARKLFSEGTNSGDPSWCSEFAQWALSQAGAVPGKGLITKKYNVQVLKIGKMKGNSKWCYSWKLPVYYRDNKKWGEVHKPGDGYKPKAGDLLINVNGSQHRSRLPDAGGDNGNHTMICTANASGDVVKIAHASGFDYSQVGNTTQHWKRVSYIIHIKWENIK